MKLRRNEYCPIHRSLFCCGREQAREERRSQFGVQRIDDPHHAGGYRELRSPAEMRELLNRKIAEQDGKCAICQQTFTDYNEIVPDHIEPKGMVEAGLVARFPNDDLVTLWNIGCPMDHLDEANRRGEWERMAGVAVELHRGQSMPNTTSSLRDVAERLSAFVIPAQENRNYFVQPEGLAAVKAFLESPHPESKAYAIVDVGAGTTEADG